jgi:hypothetical protein
MATKNLSSKAKYIPNRLINEIEVERNGRTTTIDGADLLDGAYVKKNVKFAKGSTVGSGIDNVDDWFWNYDYRHYLRDASDKKRKEVKDKFIKEGLALNGSSPKHAYIVVSTITPSELKNFKKIGKNAIKYAKGSTIEGYASIKESTKNILIEKLIDDNIDFRNDLYPYLRDEQLTKIAKKYGYTKHKNMANSLGYLMYFDLQSYFLGKYGGNTYKSGAKDWEYANGSTVEGGFDEKAYHLEQRAKKQLGVGIGLSDINKALKRYENENSENAVYQSNKLRQLKSEMEALILHYEDENKYAKGSTVKEYRKGGVMGDIYSIQNAEQFKQLITTYNELSEKFGVLNYFLDHNDNSVVFLMHGDKESMYDTIKLQRYIDALYNRGFDVFDKTKNKNITIQVDNSQGGGYVYFKLKLSKIVQYGNGGGVAVSSESGLAVGTNADLLMNEQYLQYGSGGKISRADEGTGSSNLRERAQAKIDKGMTVIDFSYTDYGGSFGDRVAIAYFKKHYPKNILVENSGYNGQNAFVFGKVADDYLEETKNYPLGFEDMEEFYYNMQNQVEEKEYKSFVKDLKSNGYKVSPNALGWLLENKSGYYNLEPNMLDYSPEDLTEELIEEGLVSKKLEFGGNMSSGFNYEIGGL